MNFNRRAQIAPIQIVKIINKNAAMRIAHRSGSEFDSLSGDFQPLPNDVVKRLSQTHQRPRPIDIGAGLERIFPLQFQQGADLRQDFCDVFFVHARMKSELERRRMQNTNGREC